MTHTACLCDIDPMCCLGFSLLKCLWGYKLTILIFVRKINIFKEIHFRTGLNKQCRHISYAAEPGIFSESILFATHATVLDT